MNISHNSDLKVMRVFGAFVLVLYVSKMYGSPELRTFVGTSVFFHLFCWVLMYLMFTWTWDLKLSSGKIESISGPLRFKRITVIDALQSVELEVGETQVDGGGDSFMLKLSVKSKLRPKPVVILSGSKADETEHFGEEAKKVSRVLGDLKINVSDHFERLYKHLHHQDFKL